MPEVKDAVRYCVECDRNESMPGMDLCRRCYRIEQDDWEREQDEWDN